MKKLKNRKNSGETLVEIMVSAALFLMMMAVMQGAISFCTNAQQKSKELRTSNAEICNNMRKGPGLADNGSASLEFSAVSADGQTVGNKVFTVKSVLKKAEVSAGSTGKTAVFYLFAGEGGGSP